MCLQQTRNNKLFLIILSLGIFANPACRKKHPPHQVNNGDAVSVANVSPEALKIWSDLKKTASGYIIVDQSFNESILLDKVEALNEFSSQPDLNSFVATARLESFISRELAHALKLNIMEPAAARGLIKKINKRPLVASELAKALNISPNSENLKLINNSGKRYASFQALFASLPENEPTDEVLRRMGKASLDEWLLSGDYKLLSLDVIIQSRVKLTAVEALIDYIEKGGVPSGTPEEFNFKLKQIIPEHFSNERFPEASLIRSTHLLPSDILKLFQEVNDTSQP